VNSPNLLAAVSNSERNKNLSDHNIKPWTKPTTRNYTGLNFRGFEVKELSGTRKQPLLGLSQLTIVIKGILFQNIRSFINKGFLRQKTLSSENVDMSV
jgi:hypothetical protein